jgi:hypothetical protein
VTLLELPDVALIRVLYFIDLEALLLVVNRVCKRLNGCYNSKDMKIEEVLKCYMSNSTLKSAIKFFNSIELTGIFRNICFLHDKPYI